MSGTLIHPSALIEEGAQLDHGVQVGPFCIISKDAKIGKNSKLLSHVVIEGIVEIGEANTIYPFSLIGAVPQDMSYAGEATSVVIGKNNLFRESTSIHRGTYKDKKITRIGDNNYIMGYCHVAHDCQLGNHIIMANQTALAGHVTIEDFANIGGQSAICQKVRIGSRTFIGAGSVVRKDLPPFMAAKEFAQVTGPNLVGLKRQGLTEENVRVICELYKMVYLSNQTTQKALEEISERYPDNPFARQFFDFVKSTQIGIQR